MASINAVHDFFTRQCELTPDTPAVQDGSSVLSYGELDMRSAALTCLLQAQGVEPGANVGICIDRGIDLAVAVLAVLKAGAAYVPLDPSYPRSRLKMMMDDSKSAVVLASRQHAGQLETHGVLMIMEELDLTSSAHANLAMPASTDESLAYIIYTSGSTGTPKGVAMPHRALANLIQWQIGMEEFSVAARVVQFTPLSFDVHFQEFFSTWAGGGTLYFISDEQRRDPARLLAFIVEHAIERLFLPFVALQQLLEVAVNYGPLPDSLRDIVTAGEQLQISTAIADFFRRSPHCRLHNHYGPSETHVVTAYTLPPDVDSWPTLPPIGRAISNTEIHLLDHQLQPVAPGDSGELCISGLSLACGYWQRPELTAERFITCPWDPSATLYRSGDLARLDDEGNIHYLGRIDGQVKIRGHRVETGEVESHIKQHAEIRDCAVVPSEGSGGERKLLAYLILDARPHGPADKRQGQQLTQWQDVWDGTYQQHSAGDPRFDISGWNSSFTSQPLAADDMRQWVDGTAARILECKPRRILEIGAGTGLIMYSVVHACEYYHATDYSSVSIDQLQRQLASVDDISAGLKASVLAADQIASLADERFDTVVLNSVTQHFVSIDYLVTVLRQACQLLDRGGRIFVGDITSLNTRALFTTSLECYKAAASDTADVLRARIQRRLGEEQELVIDPALFYRLAEEIDDIRRVSVRLKPGSYDNELSHFRYDVVLEVGDKALPTVQQEDWLDWHDSLSIAGLPARLATTANRCIGIRAVPNGRLQQASALAQCLGSGEYRRVADIEAAATELCRNRESAHPDQFLALQRDHGYTVQTLWSSDPACFDVLISEQENLYHRPPVDAGRPLQGYASQPFNVCALPGVLAELRKQLTERLPDYMHPAKYILLHQLPTTPSGKLDRRALPQPSSQRPILEQEYVAPHGEMETALTAIWAELLELDEVGVNDNFFDLGGNSILSLRLGLEIRRQLDKDIAVVTLFQYPTIRALAAHMDDQETPGVSLSESARARARKQKQAFARGKRLGKVSSR